MLFSLQFKNCSILFLFIFLFPSFEFKMSLALTVYTPCIGSSLTLPTTSLLPSKPFFPPWMTLIISTQLKNIHAQEYRWYGLSASPLDVIRDSLYSFSDFIFLPFTLIHLILFNQTLLLFHSFFRSSFLLTPSIQVVVAPSGSDAYINALSESLIILT